LQHANRIAVFLPEELNDVFPRFASANGISVHETGAFSEIFSFTDFSTSRFCCGVSGALEKSNVNLSGPT
jgi:hypothetical protein